MCRSARNIFIVSKVLLQHLVKSVYVTTYLRGCAPAILLEFATDAPVPEVLLPVLGIAEPSTPSAEDPPLPLPPSFHAP